VGLSGHLCITAIDLNPHSPDEAVIFCDFVAIQI
jgi:hypothetical protein